MKRGGPRRNRPSLLPVSLLSGARETPNSYRGTIVIVHVMGSLHPHPPQCSRPDDSCLWSLKDEPITPPDARSDGKCNPSPYHVHDASTALTANPSASCSRSRRSGARAAGERWLCTTITSSREGMMYVLWSPAPEAL